MTSWPRFGSYTSLKKKHFSTFVHNIDIVIVILYSKSDYLPLIYLSELNLFQCRSFCYQIKNRKKRLPTFPSSAGMSLTKPSLDIIQFFPPRESLISVANFFYSVCLILSICCRVYSIGIYSLSSFLSATLTILFIENVKYQVKLLTCWRKAPERWSRTAAASHCPSR